MKQQIKERIEKIRKGEVPEGYKRTRVGIIPEDWKLTKIGDIAQSTSGSTPSRNNYNKYYKSGSIHWVKTTDLNNNSITSTEENITLEAMNETSCKMLPVGTVLVAMYGGFRQIGRTGLLKISATCNQALTAIYPNDKFDSGFLQAYLNSNVTKWKNYAASSRKDPNITRKDVMDFIIPHSTLKEEKKIFKIISTWDKAIELKEKLIEQKKELKRGLMQKLLTGEVESNEFEDWEEIKLKEKGKCHRGVSYHPNDLYSNDNESTVRLLRSNNIQNGELYINKDIQYVNRNRVNQEQFLRTGDIIICMANGTKKLVGKNGYFNEKLKYNYTVGAFCAIFRCNSFDDNLMIKYIFQSNKYESFIQKLLTGTNINNLSPGDIENMKFYFPKNSTKKEQITKILYTNDRNITLLTEEVLNLKQQKKGLMQLLLTGIVRVNTGENNE